MEDISTSNLFFRGVFKTGFHYVVLGVLELTTRPSGLESRDPQDPAVASQVLRLKVCATAAYLDIKLQKLQNRSQETMFLHFYHC